MSAIGLLVPREEEEEEEEDFWEEGQIDGWCGASTNVAVD